MSDSDQNIRGSLESVIDLREVFLSIWRRKGMVVLFAFLAQGVYLTFHLSSPRLFTTSTQFIFKDSQGGGMGSLGGLADLVGIRSGSKTNLSDFFTVIMFTDEFLEKVVKRKWVRNDGDSAYLHEHWNLETYTTGPKPELRTQRKRVGTLRGEIGRFSADRYISIEKDKRTNLVNLSTRFDDARLSYDINTYLVDLLNDYLLNSTKSQVGENRRFVEKRLEEVATDLRKSEDALLAFQMRNISMTSPPILMEHGRHRRAVEINQQIFLELKKQLEMARIEELKESPVIQVIAQPQYPLQPDRRLNIKRWGVITWLGILLGTILAWWAGTRARSRGRELVSEKRKSSEPATTPV